MTVRIVATIAVIALAGAPAAAHEPADAQPVMIGHDGLDFDACGGWGVVSGLNPDGENFLAVRAAPTTQASKMDELHEGDGLWFCDGTQDRQWVGVVYSPHGAPDLNCGVSSPVPEIVPYTGPCRSGWVSARYVTLIAG